MSKVYEYEVVLRVTMDKPIGSDILTTDSIPRLITASTRAVMEIKEVVRLDHGNGPWTNGR